MIVLPFAAVVWIWHKKKVGNTDVFSCCCEIKDIFQFPFLSERFGLQELGGSTARQTAQVGRRKYSVPCSVCEGGLTGRQKSAHFHEFEFSLVQEFGLFWEFNEIQKICDFWSLRLLLGD